MINAITTVQRPANSSDECEGFTASQMPWTSFLSLLKTASSYKAIMFSLSAQPFAGRAAPRSR